VHVRINMVLQALLLGLGFLVVFVVVVNIAQGTYETAVTHPPSADPSEAIGEAVGHWMASVMLPIWSGITLVWAPLNLYGLWKLRPWGRVSTLVYSTISLFTCCCMPFGIYALVSLNLPNPSALFEGQRGSRAS
jgi:hypothetical protein